METGYVKYKRYDLDFKRSAVDLVESAKRPMAQIANELGIPYKTLERWRWQYLKRPTSTASPPGAPPSAEQLAADLEQARRKLALVERERDILKKALAICSREGEAKPGLG